MNIYTAYQPYTYLIKWSSTGMKYYGVRYAKECNPTELWNTYFTSSKYVKEYRNKFGEPDIIEIRMKFDSESKAREWEHKVLRRLQVILREDYLNKTDNKAIRSSTAWNKGLSKESHPGIAKGAEKQKGRTKFTCSSLLEASKKKTGRNKNNHQGVAMMAEKKRGRTKENDAGTAASAEKRRGVTKETNPNLASQKKGKTMFDDPSLAAASKKLSKFWEVTYPDGTKIIVKGIRAWSVDNGFLPKSVRTWAWKGKHFKGFFVRKLG